MRAPRYATACSTRTLGDALAVVRRRPPKVLPLPEGLRGVVVLVVDGLGRRLLDRYAEVAPTLSRAPGTTLDAVFPATTTTNLTSLGTGLPPASHGIVGTGIAVPGDDRPLNALTWTWERQIGGPDATGDVDPERFQPAPTIFDHARAAGVRATTVLRPEFVGSGLTRAALRHGDVVTASGIDDTLAVAVEATRGTAAIVYSHHGDLDMIGHLQGPGTDRWCAELADVDAAVRSWHERLPDGVALVVTADHGMVHVPDGGLVDLADRVELISGVRTLAGDPRARQLQVVDGALDDVLAAWRTAVGDTGTVSTRDEVLAAGWFGPPDSVRPEVVPRIGQVIVCAHTPTAWIHRDVDPLGGRLIGQHAAPTEDELLVPALVLTASHS